MIGLFTQETYGSDNNSLNSCRLCGSGDHNWLLMDFKVVGEFYYIPDTCTDANRRLV